MAERDPEDLSGVDTHALATLITESKASGGAETANTQVFIERLTRIIFYRANPSARTYSTLRNMAQRLPATRHEQLSPQLSNAYAIALD